MYSETYSIREFLNKVQDYHRHEVRLAIRAELSALEGALSRVSTREQQDHPATRYDKQLGEFLWLLDNRIDPESATASDLELYHRATRRIFGKGG